MSEDGAQLQELIDEARHLNARLGQSANGNGGSATIHVNAGGWGVAVAGGAVLLALVAVVLQGQRISDMHAVIQAEKLDRAAMERYQDAENKAIRSYIINGRLEPMRPKPEPSK